MRDAAEWERRWAEGRTRFHSDQVHADLQAHAQRFLGGGHHHILMPLCGKSVDMPYLADLGHRVTGVELVTAAVEAFWHGRDAQPTRDRAGVYARSQAGRLELLCGDIMDLEPGPYNRLWDRAALVALAPEVRPGYVNVLRRAMQPASLILLNAFSYEQSRMEGPPYSVPQTEVRSLYAGCEIEVLGERDAVDVIPFEGHDYWLVTTYLIQLPT